MGTPLRAFMTTAAAFLAASGILQAESGTWGGTIGMAMPQAGAKTWVGSTVGPSLDIMESYSLGGNDNVRMRFGYFALKASSKATQSLALPGGNQKVYPADTTNELFAFTYGGEYVRNLPFGFYALAGLGVTYVTASRTGTFDLSSSGSTTLHSTYSANNLVPYLCAGLGFQVTGSVALEGRWQSATMKNQLRPMDLKAGGFTAAAHAQFEERKVSTLTVGLTMTF